MMLRANVPCLNTTGFNWDVHADTGNGDSVAAGRTAQTSTYKALKNKSKTTNKLQRPLEVEWICVLKQFLHHATDHSKMLLTPTLFGKWETRRKKKKNRSCRLCMQRFILRRHQDILLCRIQFANDF